MVGRGKSAMDADNARRFMMATVHKETAQLLKAVEEICRRYPPSDELNFVRYLLRMIVSETDRGNGADDP
ncbi:hypothetical protein [Rhizobium sp. CF142]|uniref:hypothetical protein n=1 Tax=Rhizobium sp. CF142 TaxID=1144314 RepID=UPI00026EFDA0|nr:hypothetical protein [Rhizobium sp. CF142]EJJ26176.1 hypothetical protein PMI11_05426 [Rhizobium sp. CF142]